MQPRLNSSGPWRISPVLWLTESIASTVPWRASTGEILHGPELFSRGCIPELNQQHWLEDATDKVNQMLNEHHLSARTNWDDLRIEIRQTISRFFKRSLQRRPLVLPIIIQL